MPSDLWFLLVGLDGEPGARTVVQTVVRAVIVYGAGLTMLRLAGHRILARHSAIDVLLGILLGSILSRPVNGTAPLLATLLAAAALVALHHLLARLSARHHGLGRVLKGEPHRLVTNGRHDEAAMHAHDISANDLAESFRLCGHPPSEPVAGAWLERDGHISVVPEGGKEDGSNRPKDGP